MNSTNVTTINPRNLTDEELDSLLSIYFWLQGVVYCVLCFTGVFSNLLNIITLSRSIKHVTYKIFLGMACADLMVMLVTLAYSLSFCIYQPVRLLLGAPPKLAPGVSYSLYLWKNLWFHILNIFLCASNWCAVLLSFFRWLVVSFPLRAADYANGFIVNSSLIAVYGLSLLTQIPGWISYQFNEHGAIQANRRMYKFITITVVINGPIPLCLCVVATAALLVQLGRSQSSLRGLVGREQLAERLKDQRQLTVTLLLVVTFFITMNIPSSIYWIMDEQEYFDKFKVSKYKQNLFYLSSALCMTASYMCNFFIYILANQSFRKDLWLTLASNRQYLTLTWRSWSSSGTRLSSSRPRSTELAHISTSAH